jgi:hypothetical protein
MTLRMIPRKARPFFQVRKKLLFIETSPETLPIPFEWVEGEADNLHEFWIRSSMPQKFKAKEENMKKKFQVKSLSISDKDSF